VRGAALLIGAALALLGFGTAAAQPGTLPKPVPTDKGLPVIVRTAVQVIDASAVDEAGRAFEGTVDLRLRWEDARVEFDPGGEVGGIVDVRGEPAEARLSEIWAPDVALANLAGPPSFQTRRLRIFPDGRVELMQRTTARFTTAFDVEKFPFDRQLLPVELEEQREPSQRVVLDFRQDDVEFSRPAEGLSIDGWRPGLLHLRRATVPGWHGESQARVRAALEVTRDPTRTVAVIFLPLAAAILIPLLALWLQRVDDGEIRIETLELTNILIGGLFALVALNFTISSSFPGLIDGDNTVTRLLGLNYLCLALSLVINIAVFRYNVVGRLFGRHVLNQTFRYLTWALPLLVLATATAIILVAMA
jgi:hypothetical protein